MCVTMNLLETCLSSLGNIGSVKLSCFAVMFSHAAQIQIPGKLKIFVFASLNRSLTPSRSPSGKELLVVLHHMLRLYVESGLELPRCNNTVETLLFTSKFEGLRKRENWLMMTAHLQPELPESHVRAEIVCRLSVTFRSRGRISDSERILNEFLNSQSLELNQESHDILGLLHLLQAINQAYCFDFHETREKTCK